MDCNKPYLYHYTSITSLEAIMRNKTIRLNSLANMNDLQEQQTADAKDLGRYIFVSSWTDETEESIPMWKLYASLDAGVRIALPPNPFKRQKTEVERLAKKIGAAFIADNGEKIMDTFLDLNDLVDKSCYSPEMMSGDILKQVEYVDDESLLIPQVVEESKESISIKFGKLGIYKDTHWDFEKEWRYRLTFAPFVYAPSPLIMLIMFNINANLFKKGMGDLSFTFYDLEIDQQNFEKMIVTPSPQMTAENRKMLDGILSKYNPKATIQESKLFGKIKLK